MLEADAYAPLILEMIWPLKGHHEGKCQPLKVKARIMYKFLNDGQFWTLLFFFTMKLIVSQSIFISEKINKNNMQRTNVTSYKCQQIRMVNE